MLYTIGEIMDSGSYWWFEVVSDSPVKDFEEKILTTLKTEVPNIFTVNFERHCNLQCRHCVYQPEKSSFEHSAQADIEGIMLNIARQMPQHATLKHEGRMLSEWHLNILERVHQVRPDIHLSLIDNGSYANFIKQFHKCNLKLDSLDISIDGTRESHNNQRDHKNRVAYDMAVNGLRHAREVVSEGRRVSSLMTLTSLNYADVEATAEFLFSPNPNGNGLPYADEFHITTMTPFRKSHQEIEISIEQLQIAWEQVKKITRKYGRERVIFKLYLHDDLLKFARAVGLEKVSKALSEECVRADTGRITFEIDGAGGVTFFPLSIWPQETFLIDADGALRLAHSMQYTLEELLEEKGEASIYTVKWLDTKSDFVESYNETVDCWWDRLGKNYLREEKEVIQKIKNR